MLLTEMQREIQTHADANTSHCVLARTWNGVQPYATLRAQHHFAPRSTRWEPSAMLLACLLSMRAYEGDAATWPPLRTEARTAVRTGHGEGARARCLSSEVLLALFANACALLPRLPVANDQSWGRPVLQLTMRYLEVALDKYTRVIVHV